MVLKDYLEKSHAENHGYYFIVTCPICHKKEAYLYMADIERQKKNPKHKIPIRCNRLNKCGKTTYLEEEIEIDESALCQSKEAQKIGITEEGVDLLQTLCKMSKLLPDFNFNLRGISNKILKDYGLLYLKDGWASFVKGKGSKFDKKYWSKNYQNRDILIPIYDLKGNLDRLLLRSAFSQCPKKEIQVKLRKNASEIWNCADLINKDKPYVTITEGVYDALSIIEVAGKYKNEIGIVSLPGVKKYKKIVNLIKDNFDACKDKVIIIAFDTDKGGQDNYQKLKNELEKMNIRTAALDLKGHKDANEFLTVSRLAFCLTVRNLIKNLKGEC